MKPGYVKFAKADLKKLADLVSDDFTTNLDRFNNETRQLFNAGILLNDNVNATLVDFTFYSDSALTPLTHGVETVIANPMPTIPIGFTPILAEDAAGNALQIESWKYNRRPKAGDGSVIQKQLGITVNLAPPSGYCQLANNSVQSIPSASTTFATFAAAAQFSSGALLYNGTNGIIVGAAGVVLVSYQVGFVASSAGTLRTAYLTHNAGGSKFATSIQYPNAVQVALLTGAETWDVSSGQTIQLVPSQDTGGALNTSAAAAAIPTRMSAKYVDVLPGTQFRCLGILWGG